MLEALSKYKVWIFAAIAVFVAVLLMIAGQYLVSSLLAIFASLAMGGEAALREAEDRNKELMREQIQALVKQRKEAAKEAERLREIAQRVYEDSAEDVRKAILDGTKEGGSHDPQ